MFSRDYDSGKRRQGEFVKLFTSARSWCTSPRELTEQMLSRSPAGGGALCLEFVIEGTAQTYQV
jgi:hypothetical protein